MTAQDADLRSKINDALDSARPALLDHLKEAVRSTTRAGELALLVLAALHDEVPVDDEVLSRAIERLAKAKPDQTYDLALRLLVLEACPTFPDRDQLARHDGKKLLSHVSRDGAFQYFEEPVAWDLSNTQYGALGLRAASALGVKVRRSVWDRMARVVGDQQGEDGGFGYTRAYAHVKAYASMTAAGIAVLAICRQELGDGYQGRKSLDRQIEAGWKWFAENANTIGRTKEKWSFYFHYGLERAAILCDVDKVDGKHDWYSNGARMFVDEQLYGGGWRSVEDGHPGQHLSNKRGDSVPTSFAILFLRRKFQKTSGGPITERVIRLVNIGPMSKQPDVDECARQLASRGIDAMPELLHALRSEVQPQRQAASQALQKICGEAFGYDPALDRKGNRRAIRDAETWYMEHR